MAILRITNHCRHDAVLTNEYRGFSESSDIQGIVAGESWVCLQPNLGGFSCRNFDNYKHQVISDKLARLCFVLDFFTDVDNGRGAIAVPNRYRRTYEDSIVYELYKLWLSIRVHSCKHLKRAFGILLSLAFPSRSHLSQ